MAKDSEQYSEQQARQRLEAALRGARIAGHKPMDSLTRKKPKVKKAKKKPLKSGPPLSDQ